MWPYDSFHVRIGFHLVGGLSTGGCVTLANMASLPKELYGDGGRRVTNPFEDEDASYCVLRNDEGQHSLWRTDISCPAGWQKIYEAGSRSEALNYVNQHWHDMRPGGSIPGASHA
jgi:MbtH protein